MIQTTYDSQKNLLVIKFSDRVDTAKSKRVLIVTLKSRQEAEEYLRGL